MRPSATATLRRRCSMARKRASMREGPLAELFKATEAAQRQAEEQAKPDEPHEATVEHVHSWEEERAPAQRTATPQPPAPAPRPEPTPPPAPEPPPAARYMEPLPEPP